MIPLPAWVDQEAWDAFVQKRIDTKKPMSHEAAKRQLARLYKIHNAGLDANDALWCAADRGNYDVWPPKPMELPTSAASGYEATQARLKAEAERKASPPPARVLAMVSRRKTA